MPASPEIDLEAIGEKAKELIKAFVDEKHKDSEIKKEEEPIGFGLKAVKLTFVMDESIGSTDKLEEQIKEMKINDKKTVQSVEVADVRRAIG